MLITVIYQWGVRRNYLLYYQVTNGKQNIKNSNANKNNFILSKKVWQVEKK